MILPDSRSRPSAPFSPPVLPPDENNGSLRRLLEAAVVAFAERGYHGVSVRDLTSAVGIKAGSFYAHFSSKEQLLAELMVLGHESHLATLRDAILGAGPDAKDQLRDAVRANTTFHATWPVLAIVCNTELHALAPETRDRIISLRHDAGVLLGAVIDRGNAAGEFHCNDKWLAMSAIGGMGVRVAWWYRPTGSPDGGDPLQSYPTQALRWLPETDHTVEAVAEAYADYALRIVGAEQ